MEIKNLGLGLYFLATMLATIAVANGLDTLRLFSNPVVIPAIIFYFIYDRQEKYNHWYGLVLFLCFIGDIMVFLDLDVVLYIMIPYFLSYLILFYFVLKDVCIIKFNKKIFFFTLLIFFCLFALVAFLINSISVKNPQLVMPGTVYGLFLITYCSLGIYNFLATGNNSSIYLLFFLLLSVFSDIFYVVFKLITSFRSLVFIGFCAQLISYYFLVKYFSVRKYPYKNNQYNQINLSK